MRHDKKYCASLAAAVLLAALMICQGAAYGLTPAVGEKAADFTLPTHDGKSLTLSDLSGKRAAVLVFFATWCPYCMEEVPAVKSFVEASKDKGVLVYGIDTQQKKDIVGKFIKDRDINYRILLDEDGKTAEAYGVTGIPNVVGIDWKGVVRYRDYRMPKDTEGFIKQLTDGLALAKETPPQAPASTQAQSPASPPSDNNKDEAAKVTKDDLLKWTNDGQKLAVIDVLPASDYAKSHIKGSISIPVDDLNKRAAELDKNARTVTYCASYQCPASTGAAEILMSLGFTNVYDYKGGMREWTEAGLPLESEK